MEAANTQKIQKDEDIFALAHKQLEERRKIDDEQEQRCIIDAIRKNNDGFIEKDENFADNIKTVSADDSTLIFCGAPNSGKSTLLARFLEYGGAVTVRQQPPEKSIALEYKFVNRIRGNDRQLVHCWELAGGGSLVNLLELPFNQHAGFRVSSLLLFVDLTVPEQFRQVIDPIMALCRKQVEKWSATSTELQRKKSEESKLLKPLGIPLVLVCGRYDDFQNFESERKRLTYRLIRQFAHMNGASIITFSTRMDSLIQKALLLLSNIVSDSRFLKTYSTDPHQPLFVLPHGIDLFEKIDPSTEFLTTSMSSHSEAMFNFIQSLNSAFPQLPLQINDAGGDESDKKQQFDEPAIDMLVEEQMRKLELHVRELQNRLQAEKML